MYFDTTSDQAIKLWWRKHFREAGLPSSDPLGYSKHLRPADIVATGFMPGTSAGGDVIAGSTRSRRIELERAAHSLHLQFGQIRNCQLPD
jgi:hypothetical protein